MSPGARLAVVWAALLAGLAVLLVKVPKAGLDRPSPASTLPAPESPPLEGAQELYARGVLAAERDDLAEALARFDAALREDPGLTPAYVQKAVLLARAPGADPAGIRALLAEAARRGFDRRQALDRIESLLGQAPPESLPGRVLFQKAVLLGFGDPADPEGARAALRKAAEAGLAVPGGLEAQVGPDPGR